MDVLGITGVILTHRLEDQGANHQPSNLLTPHSTSGSTASSWLVVGRGCWLSVKSIATVIQAVSDPLVTSGKNSVFPEWLLSGCYQPLGEKCLQRGLPPHDWFVCYPVAAVIEDNHKSASRC